MAKRKNVEVAVPESAVNDMNTVAAGIFAAQEQAQALGDWLAPHPVDSVILMDPDEIDMRPELNGREMDTAKVKEYAANFKARIGEGKNPQLQELVGFYPPGSNQLQLILGFHRGHAAKLHNVQAEREGRAPMLVRVRVAPEPTAIDRLVDNYTENRKNNPLSPVAEMHYFQTLKQEHGLDNKTIARRLNVSAPLVSLRLGLAVLPVEVLKLVESGELPVKAAQALATMPDDKTRQKVVDRALAVFASMGDPEKLKTMKVPREAIVKQLIEEAGGPQGDVDGAGNGDGTTGDNGETPAPAPEPLRRNVSAVKAQRFMEAAIQFPNTPTSTRNVLRAVLGWLSGERDEIKMLNAVTKACGDEYKAIDWQGVATGALPPVVGGTAGNADGSTGDNGAAKGKRGRKKEVTLQTAVDPAAGMPPAA